MRTNNKNSEELTIATRAAGQLGQAIERYRARSKLTQAALAKSAGRGREREVSFNFVKLERRYMEDAAFNKAVNIFRQLIEQHGFVPSEIREALFFAQYMFEMARAEAVVSTEEEWDKIRLAREIMKKVFVEAPDDPQT